MSDQRDTTRGEGRGLERGIERLESRREAKQDRRMAGELRGQRVRGGAERLLTRTMSGAIYVVVVVTCLFVGPLATAAIIAAMAWLCCSEFYRMARMGGRMPNEVLGLTLAVAYPPAAWQWGAPALSILTYLLLASCAVWYVATPRANVADVAVTALGPLYTSLTLSSVVLIRTSAPGSDAALLTLGVVGSVWANDAVAYLVGSRIGRHRLAPRISPKKSVEGLCGGLVASVVVWLLVWVLGVRGVTLPLALICGPVVGLTSVIGDLFESRVKRGVGVKDSGAIMPGHGGMLDRSDSMIFGCTAAYLLLLVGTIL